MIQLKQELIQLRVSMKLFIPKYSANNSNCYLELQATTVNATPEPELLEHVVTSAACFGFSDMDATT